MNTELDLPLQMPAPAVSADAVELLVKILAGAEAWLKAQEIEDAEGWMTANQIAGQMGDDVTERAVRKVASAAAPAVVSFPGSRGYKLWQLCSVEEINHCIESFESQGKDMFKRAILYRRAYHARFRGAPPAERAAGEACQPAARAEQSAAS